MSAVIDELVYFTKIDLSGWNSGIAEATASLDNFSGSAMEKLQGFELPAPTMGAMAEPDAPALPALDPAEMLGGLHAALGPLRAELTQAMGQALVPLTTMAARISHQFDEVGGTLIGVAKRVDEHVKFPTVLKGLQSLRDKARSAFKDVGEETEEGASRFREYGRKVARGLDVGLSSIIRFRKATHFLGSLGSITKQSLDSFSRLRPPSLKFDFSTQINNVSRAASSAVRPVKDFAGSLALAAGVGFSGYAAANFFRSSIIGASDLNESLSATDAILKDSAPAVKAFADSMAKQFGFVKREILDAATGFGGIAKGLGDLKGTDLSDFAVKFTKAAADFTSQKNISFKESTQALRTVLAGEQSDVLKAAGVVILETTVKEYALAKGIAKVGEELDQQTKLAIRAELLTKKLADAAGDLEKTQYEAANQMRKFSGGFTNLATEIGTSLLPILKQASQFGTTLLYALGAGFERLKPLIDGFAVKLATNFAQARDLVGELIPGFATFGEAMIEKFSLVAETVYGVLPSFNDVAMTAHTFFESAYMGITGLIDGFGAFGETIANTFGGGNTSLIDSFFSAIQTGFDTAMFATRNYAELFQIAMVTIGQYGAHLIDTIGLIPTNLARIGEYVANNWTKLFFGAFASIGARLASLLDSIPEAIKTLDAGKLSIYNREDEVNAAYGDSLSKFPEMVKAQWLDVSSAIDSSIASIASKETKFATRMDEITQKRSWISPDINATPGKPGGLFGLPGDDEDDDPLGKKKKGKKEHAFGAAIEVNTKEAHSVLMAAQYGMKPKELTTIAKTLQSILAEQQKANKLAGNKPPAPVVRQIALP